MLRSRVQLRDSVVGLISAQRFDHHGKLNEKGSQLQTAHKSMFNTNVSPFGRLQCMVDIGQYLVKLGRLPDHIYMYKRW